MTNNTVVPVIIEIPKGSSNKYEFDPLTHRLKLDRVLYGANFYPSEYGMIENTLDWDGDPLDVIALATYPTIPGVEVRVRVLGSIKMIDNGEIDTKIFGVFADDPRFNAYKKISDVPQHLRDEIEMFFLQYKTLQKKFVKITGWGNAEDAAKEIQECQKRFQKYEKRLTEPHGKENIMKEWKLKGWGRG